MFSHINRFKPSAVAAVLGVTALLISGTAFASLVQAPTVQVLGSGLGAVNTLVTARDNSTPNTLATESGCVSSTGGATFNLACLNGLEGGDNQAINKTRLVSTVSSTTAGDLALVVNIAETGQDVSVVLTDLYLSLYSLAGNLLGNFQYDGPDLELTQGLGTGIGGSGFVFVLDAPQRAQAMAACPVLSNCYAGGGFQFAEGSTNNGLETLYVMAVTDGGVAQPPQEIPEPATLGLVALGLLGSAAARWKRQA